MEVCDADSCRDNALVAEARESREVTTSVTKENPHLYNNRFTVVRGRKSVKKRHT